MMPLSTVSGDVMSPSLFGSLTWLGSVSLVVYALWLTMGPNVVRYLRHHAHCRRLPVELQIVLSGVFAFSGSLGLLWAILGFLQPAIHLDVFSPLGALIGGSVMGIALIGPATYSITQRSLPKAWTGLRTTRYF